MSICARCDQVIDEEHDSNTIEWNNREYHEKCFHCFACQKSLKNKLAYKNQTNDKFFCSICIKKQNEMIESCFRCGKNFLPNTQYTEFDGKYYHKSCFTCSSCQKSIVTEKFYVNKDGFLCEMCHEMTLEKCESCRKTISKGHFVILEDKKYHDTCMKCAKCKGNIGEKMCFTKSKDGSFLCRLCDQDQTKVFIPVQ